MNELISPSEALVTANEKRPTLVFDTDAEYAPAIDVSGISSVIVAVRPDRMEIPACSSRAFQTISTESSTLILLSSTTTE